MGAPTVSTFLRRLRQAMAAEALADTSDRDLVERFRATHDEAAFRALVERHGAMVFQVCRRALACAADAEDAFQATFLVLVRRGHTVRRQASVASWLHGVAHRTALKLRTEAARRRKREGKVAEARPAAVTDETPWGEVRGVLDDELGRLPAGCRAALVLCYLEGRTQDEAAAQLGVSKSTLRRQLDRGRDLLGRRLARRGLVPAAALAARLVADSVNASVPNALVVRTTASAALTAAGRAAPAGVLSARVAALSHGVSTAMLYAKYKTVAGLVACGLALGLGVRELGPSPASAQEAKAPAARAAAPDIEPIDPDLVFDPAVQKQLRLSPNQVRQLTEARDKGGAKVADQVKRAAEIEQRIKKLQEEIDRLHEERGAAQHAVDKAQADGVKAVIPQVLSRDAVAELRQLTLQRMRLSDVLLDARMKARLELNDEQVKRIQELREKQGVFLYQGLARSYAESTVDFTPVRLGMHYLVTDLDDRSRAELLKVLTPRQREALERLTGMPLDKKKE